MSEGPLNPWWERPDNREPSIIGRYPSHSDWCSHLFGRGVLNKDHDRCIGANFCVARIRGRTPAWRSPQKRTP